MSYLEKDKRIAKWSKLTLRNNFMFRLVMEKQELCKKLIECILGIKIKSISYMEHEKSFEANLRSKGIRLDLFVIDEDGVAYDIEMQMDNSYKEFLGRRTRYYISTMDNNALKKGERYSQLRKSYVIFICTFDPFGRGLAKYTFNAICNEDHSLVLDDGVTRVFINTEGDRHRISKELASLIGYISTGEVTDDYTKDLDEEVRALRNDDGRERDYMTYMQTIMEHEDMAYSQGITQGISQANKAMAIKMLKANKPYEEISEFTELTMSDIRELAASLHIVH
ncbi:MAG: Rpn family recombination-promoting nuclease/putative transposase [Anaerovibrio slackiae]|uniref:Rpn family recombination-promoting nuclease/putative transposase n=1 Tax=Anaerovibrio slackiae TaxID=2652309 RepID=UPI0023EFEAD8|nr:Rpn family recombination-promoting nuclease/putative transposase [Anaerovibrio slackiae]MDD6164311.1 Rpn family recombination-promoting nuclease/putative transposase [Anaerovibrio slackiae]